jgi:hypothetical protein
MANSSPIRFGRDFTQASPQTSDLWLPVYGGEVLAAFEEMTVAKEIVRMMSISSGYQMEFPMVHKMSAERHLAGTELLGTDIDTGKRVISTDDRPLVAHFDLDDVDLAMSHFELRSEIAKQAGRALARELDKNVLQLAIRASREGADAGASPFNGGGYKANPALALDGSAWTSAGLPTLATAAWTKDQALEILKALEDIVIAWDQRDIPQEERYCVVPTDCWHRLRNLGLPASMSSTFTTVGYDPFNRSAASTGTPAQADSSRADALEYLGVRIVRSNFLPNGDNVTTGEEKYRGNFAATRAVAIQKQAVGVLTLMGVQTETDRDVRRQSDFFVTKMLYGGGTLRPECAVEIAYSA